MVPSRIRAGTSSCLLTTHGRRPAIGGHACVLSATGAVLVDPSPQALTTIAIVTAITMTREPRHRRRRDDVDVPDRKSSRRTAKLGRSAGGLRTARPPSRDSVES